MTRRNWAERGVLVLGAEGMLGRDLVSLFDRRAAESEAGRVVGWDIGDLDIRDRGAVGRALAALKPSVVVNAAAYTDVDGCEADADLATAVNAEGAGNVATACGDVDAKMVHFGTDFIFDGSAKRPYRPDDPANPLSAYGRSKWEGEQAIRAAGCRHVIVRTSWLFGLEGHNFVEAILRKAQAAEPLRVVTDQIGSPTLTLDLADAVVRLLDAGASGTLHFANSGRCSWFEFAQTIVRQAGVDQGVEPITSDQLGRPARRPAYSVLDTANYVEVTGAQPPPWEDALRQYLNARPTLEAGARRVHANRGDA